MAEKTGKRDKSLGDLVYFPVVFNAVGLSVTGMLFAVFPETSFGSAIFNTVIYSYTFILEWLLAFIVIRRLRRQGITIRKFIVPRKNFRLLPAIYVFFSLNVLFETYMILSLITGWIPPLRDLSPIQVVFFLVLSSVTAGFVEELIWRGYFIEKILAKGSSERRAIIYSSVSFAFIHGFFLIDKLAVTFLFGIIAGLYYVRERSLPVLMASHVIVNVAAWILTIFVF